MPPRSKHGAPRRSEPRLPLHLALPDLRARAPLDSWGSELVVRRKMVVGCFQEKHKLNVDRIPRASTLKLFLQSKFPEWVARVPMEYSLYVDESGDLGIDKVRSGACASGASPFLTLGAILLPWNLEKDFEDFLNDMKSEIGSDLHCKKLNHFDKAFFARRLTEFARLREGIVLFGVISKKETLEKSYKGVIRESKKPDQRYYNKCIQFLLQMLGAYSAKNKICRDDIRIILETRGKHDYEKLRNYTRAIINNPKYESAKSLRGINPDFITNKTKAEEIKLAAADLIAHSLFSSVDSKKYNYSIPEERYLRELLPIFNQDPHSKDLGCYGIEYITGIRNMGFSGRQKKFAEKLVRKGIAGDKGNR